MKVGPVYPFDHIARMKLNDHLLMVVYRDGLLHWHQKLRGIPEHRYSYSGWVKNIAFNHPILTTHLILLEFKTYFLSLPMFIPIFAV